MKKSILSLMVGLLFVPASSSLAEVIVYDGTNTGLLRPDNISLTPGPSSLYPNAITGNSVTVTGGSPLSVYGGLTNSGNATGNTVNMNGGTTFDIYGGYSINGNATGNTVNFNNNLHANSYIVGGFSANGTSSGNTVNFNSGSAEYVYGGESYTGTVSDNTVNFNGGFAQEIAGGFNDSGDANGNTVDFKGGSADYVTGGQSTDGNALANHIIIGNGTINQTVTGGYTRNGDASANIVTVNGSSVTGHITGGYSITKNANNNIVNFNAGSSGNIIYGGKSDDGNANGNTVNINNSTAMLAIGGFSHYGSANNNIVNISNSTLTGDFHGAVYGGYSDTGLDVLNNTVTITNSVLGTDIFGGVTEGNGVASGNTITLIDSTANQGVYGGYSLSQDAKNNTVTITGNSTVTGEIFGGISFWGDVTGNTVNLLGGTVTGNVWGGGYSNSSGKDVFTGNTLNVASRFNLTGLYNFEYLNFNLPADAQLNDPLITAGTVQLGGTSTVKSINVASGNSAIKVGDTVTLVSSTGTPIGGALSANTAQGKKGLSLIYDWEDVQINNTASSGTLTARLAGETVNPDSQKLLLGRVVELALLKQGGDLLAGQAIENMVRSAQNGDQGFFAMQGGDSHYRTDPRFSMDSFTLMAGASRGRTLRSGTLVSGAAFVEAGTGHYSNFHDVMDLSPINVHGNAHYFGAGLMGDVRTPDGYQFDAAFRIGQVTGDLITNYYSGGQRASFDDTSTLYMGAHVNAAYQWQFSQDDMLNTYARYSWTHMAKDNVTVLDDVYHFDSANSHRLRVGTKYARTSGAFMPYAGIAYEYEFDGKAGGHVYGHRMADIDLGGSTVVAEVGVSWLPTNKDNLKMNVALEGFAGKREGVMASARLNYRF